MFVDIYAIQTVPPSNINRDDTGSPKTAYFGGVQRARVSSQAWKRAMRQEFEKYLPKDSLGVRTKLAAELIAQRIAEKRPDLEAVALDFGAATLKALGIAVEASKRSGDDEGKQATSYLVFISRRELDALSEVAIGWADAGLKPDKLDAAAKKEAKAAFHGTGAVDIALFGRMLADAPDLNTDAAAQVAHAISVDRVTQEYDYFTAVDDCSSEDNVGAGMIGTVDFNSSTLYRYATVNIDSLYEQLSDAEATACGVTAFVEAFARSMPTGKQNTFANRTLPSCILVSLRDEQPVNIVSAFECPITAAASTSVARQAAAKLGAAVEAFERAYGMPAHKAWNTVVGEPVVELDAVSESVCLGDLVAGLHDEVLAYLGSGE